MGIFMFLTSERLVRRFSRPPSASISSIALLHQQGSVENRDTEPKAPHIICKYDKLVQNPLSLNFSMLQPP